MGPKIGKVGAETGLKAALLRKSAKDRERVITFSGLGPLGGASRADTGIKKQENKKRETGTEE